MAKDLNKHFNKEDIQMELSLRKDSPHHMLKGKYKLKQQRDIATNLLEWPKFRTLTTPIVGNAKDMEQQELQFIFYGNPKWYSYFGRLIFGFLQNKTHFYYMIQQFGS